MNSEMLRRNMFIGNGTKIPRGIPRLVFVLYLAIAFVTLVMLGLFAIGPSARNVYVPFFVAGINFVLILFTDGKSLRTGKGVLLYAKACQRAPWTTVSLSLLHAFFTAITAVWAMMVLAPFATDFLIIALCFLPVILSAFVWWLFAATGMLFSWIFRKE